MITVNRGNVALNGTFMTLLAELQSAINAMDKMMDENPELSAVYANKSVLEIITDITDIGKRVKASGLTPQEHLATLEKK